MPKQINDADVYRAVIDIFIAEGYSNTTTKAIAQAAGINEATLFRKYGSKEALLTKAIKAQLADTPLTNIHYTGDLRADLLAMVNAFLSAEETAGQLVVALITQVPFHPELAQAAQSTVKNNLEMAHVIERYQNKGMLKAQYPLGAIADLLGPLMMRRMFANVVAGLSAKAIDAEQVVDSFLYGKSIQEQ